MSDKIITLVAVERGFYNGKLVEPGAKIQFNTASADGKGTRNPPKWAVPEGDPALDKPKPKPVGDLRPVETQKAVEKKQKGLSDDLVG